VATAAATAASVVALLDSKALIAVPHGPGQQAVRGRLLPPPYQVVSLFQGRSPWMMALIVLVALAGVAPLALAAVRPLLGWRIGWLALLAVPWTGIHWVLPVRGTLFWSWPWDPVQVAVLVMVFVAAGVRHARGVLWWMWALTLLPWWLHAGQARPGLTVLALGTILFTAAAIAADALGGRSRARLALAGAAERAEAEAARRAVLEERARIARELHDVVAHHLSLIVVRAQSAPYRLTCPADTSAEFGELSETAREALTEMQRLLGVLRTGEAAERAPQPQLGDLPALIEDARRAGLAIKLSQHGPLDGLPAAVGVCGYRIVQESLSNAGRHAPGAAISVAVAVKPRLVLVKISNGPPAAARNGATAPAMTVNGRGHGHGLAGMRERVALLGGTFAAGPTQGGGFEVTAELPAGEPA
jgi:signal transduction histidine kinase